MIDDVRRWESEHPHLSESEEAHLRGLIANGLSETRLFLGTLYRDFTNGSRRSQIARLVKRKDAIPWGITSLHAMDPEVPQVE